MSSKMSSCSSSSFPGFVIENTTIAVDFWPTKKYTHITHAFLTHAHTDHTQNLDASYTQHTIYCTEVTKKLMMDLRGIKESQFKTLDMDRTHIMKLDETESFNVTLIDANHCPGAVMFLFEGYFGSILATGDFRYTPSMFTDTALKGKEIEICYLDNTYLHEKFDKTIPPRKAAIKELIQLITKHRIEASKLEVPVELIFLIKLKLLGKEDILVDLYNFFQVPIVVAAPRYKRYTETLLISPKTFSVKPHPDSFIFVEDTDLLSSTEIVQFLQNKSVINIEPTCLPGRESTKCVKIPYTDHSSNSEIHEFIRQLRPKKIVPIVRQALPGNIDTTDIDPLRKYLSKKPMIKGVTEMYKLLLKSSTSVKRGANLNLFQLAKKTSQQHFDTPFERLKRVKKFDLANRENLDQGTDDLSTSTPINNGRMLAPAVTPIPPALSNVTLRRRSTRLKKTEIEYETPEKKHVQIDDKDMESIIEMKRKRKGGDRRSPTRPVAILKKPKEFKAQSSYKLRSGLITMATITEEQSSQENICDSETDSKVYVSDPFETSHVSESNASVEMIIEEHEASKNTSQSFCFYTEDLLKQSKWKRLSDQVEILQNLSNDDTFSELSPVKKVVMEKDSEVNKLIKDLNGIEGSSQESTALADSTNKNADVEIKIGVEDSASESEKSVVFKSTENEIANAEEELDSDDSLICFSDLEQMERSPDEKNENYLEWAFMKLGALGGEHVLQFDEKNLIFTGW